MKVLSQFARPLAISPAEAVVCAALCCVLAGVAEIPQVSAEFYRHDPAQALLARVNVNTADFSELMSLPGMTSRRAHAIQKAREKHGAFGSIEELGKVSGMTPAYVYRIQDLIECGKAE